jgi:uncharacterized hydrophobic protein (TIGR00271 family)
MKADPSKSISFSRVLGLSDAVALGFCVSVSLIYSVVVPVVQFSKGEAPIIWLVGAVIFLPIILSYAERASCAPRNGDPYALARSTGSVPLVFATGWLILGGYICLGGLLTFVVVSRMMGVLKLVLNVHIEDYWLIMIVIILSYANSVIALRGGRRRRSILVLTTVLLLIGAIIWSFLYHPPSPEKLQDQEPLRQWMGEVGILAAGLWCIDLVLRHGEQFRDANRTILRGLVVVWTVVSVLGSVAAYMLLQFSDLGTEFWMTQLSWDENRLYIVFLLTAMILGWIGLARVLSGALQLTDALTCDGFLPQWLDTTRAKLRGPFIPLTFFAAVIALVAIRELETLLIGVAALTFLWITALVITPHARRRTKELPSERRPRLPLHPLFPGLAVAVSLFFSWFLPRESLTTGLAWVVIGGIYFLLYARRGNIAAQQRDFVVGAGDAEGLESTYRVLVNIEQNRNIPSLLRAGANLARARDGELLLLHVLRVDESIGRREIREVAEWEWLRFERLAQSAGDLAVPVRLLTRVAPSVTAGILSTAAEQNADFILLDWDQMSPEMTLEPFVERVFVSTSRPAGILRGAVTGPWNSVLVAGTGGPNVPLAVETGEALAQVHGGKVEFLKVVRPSAAAKKSSQPAHRAHEAFELPPDIEERVVEGTNMRETIIAASKECDLLLVGASVDPLVNQAVLEGLPAEIVRDRTEPTLVVKRAERHRKFWLQRAWGMLSRLVPSLTLRERAEVFTEMRRSARANVDFYAMMCLASGIAILGLILDSAAVIIGAMLVAPLMSPMLSVAHGIVRGSLVMIRQGIDSTLKGTLVAIGVSTGICAILPYVPPTNEILARTTPTVIDLMVALVSGAAGAYAVSRKWVAAALPGVAISAALVPPLCVVGYGLASSRFLIAGGALLLFMANLSAIVLVSAIVFLLVGFRPMRTERGRVVTNAMLVAIVFIIALSIPLSFATRSAVRVIKLEGKLEELILEAEEKEKFDLENLSIKNQKGVYVINATVYAYKDFPPGYVKNMAQRLTERVGVPVRISAKVVRASLAETSAGEKKKKEKEDKKGKEKEPEK